MHLTKSEPTQSKALHILHVPLGEGAAGAHCSAMCEVAQLG